MALQQQETREKVLLVEGKDDLYLVREICKVHSLELDFVIEEKEGITLLLKSIEPEMKQSGLEILGVIIDADDRPASCWDKLRYRFQQVGVELPKEFGQNGTIIPGDIRVGLWLMPDNRSPGALEDFIQRMIPAKDPVWPLSKRYIQDIPIKERKFGRTKTLRAELYAWLATRKTPGRISSAISSRDLDAKGVLSQSFVGWLKELYGNDT